MSPFYSQKLLLWYNSDVLSGFCLSVYILFVQKVFVIFIYIRYTMKLDKTSLTVRICLFLLAITSLLWTFYPCCIKKTNDYFIHSHHRMIYGDKLSLSYKTLFTFRCKKHYLSVYIMYIQYIYIVHNILHNMYTKTLSNII